jgi:hypothetical protein
MIQSRRRRLSALAALALVCAGLAAPQATAAGCAASTKQAFLAWNDIRWYALAPGGSAESSAGWTLAGGARVVAGNEPFYVTQAGDTSSLALPSGSSATTAEFCVGRDFPTIRLFAANSGSWLSMLKVEILYPTTSGETAAATAGLLVGGSTWLPTRAAALVKPTNALVGADGTMFVRLRFTPLGLQSGWRVDDVYVDPFVSRR